MIQSDDISWDAESSSVPNKTMCAILGRCVCVLGPCVFAWHFPGLTAKLLMRYFVICRSTEAEVGCGSKKHGVE